MATIQYCLNTSTIRPTPLLDKIRITGKAGFKAIELWNDDLTAYVAAGGSLNEVKTALDDAGLRVATVIALHGWLGSRGAQHRQALDEARRRMEQALAVRAPFIIATPPLEPTDLSQCGRDYRELLEIGLSMGITPAMEYLGFVPTVYSIEQAWEIISTANHPAGKIVMDPFHILRGGGSIQSITKVPVERVAIWHWNDIPKVPPVAQLSDEHRVLPGDGSGPLREIERLIKGQGYRGYVSLELFNPELWARDPEEVARLGLEKMQAYFSH